MSAFMRGQEVRREQFDWGVIGWRCTPAVVGAKQLVVMDVEILPGAGHDFHRHPLQEEVIIVTVRVKSNNGWAKKCASCARAIRRI